MTARSEVDRKLEFGELPGAAPFRLFGRSCVAPKSCDGCGDELREGESELQLVDSAGNTRNFHSPCGLYLISRIPQACLDPAPVEIS